MEIRDIEPLESFDPEVGLLLSALVDSTREWMENLSDITPLALQWQATPSSYSIGALLLHLIDAEDYWFRVIIGGQIRTATEESLLQSEELDQYEGYWPTPPQQPIEWYFQLHKQYRARAFDGLKGIRPGDVIGEPRLRRSATVRWILTHVLQHDSYTGGQIVAIHELYKKMAKL